MRIFAWVIEKFAFGIKKWSNYESRMKEKLTVLNHPTKQITAKILSDRELKECCKTYLSAILNRITYFLPRQKKLINMNCKTCSNKIPLIDIN